MLCVDCCKEPCVCQVSMASPHGKREPSQRYIYKECATPGCTTMIGWMVGSLQGSEECQWCEAGVSHAMVEGREA